ncbi:hypothetical protein BDY24DRAFT_416036 [Mrakia frigida]|uniref:uncharacterized protein n=1 Tax=Mrakia frigida TaxID=29902 RepID=UPI003FCC16DB
MDPERQITLLELADEVMEVKRWSIQEEEEEEGEDATSAEARGLDCLAHSCSSPLTPTQDRFPLFPRSISKSSHITSSTDLPLSGPTTPTPVFASYSALHTFDPKIGQPSSPSSCHQPNLLLLHPFAVPAFFSTSPSSSTTNGTSSDSRSSFSVLNLSRSESDKGLLDDYFASTSLTSFARTISNVETLSDNLSNVKVTDGGFPRDVDGQDQFEFALVFGLYI